MTKPQSCADMIDAGDIELDKKKLEWLDRWYTNYVVPWAERREVEKWANQNLRTDRG